MDKGNRGNNGVIVRKLQGYELQDRSISEAAEGRKSRSFGRTFKIDGR